MSERDLSKYVRRVMKLKGLTHKDVQRLSGGRITDAYVASISIGRAGNPSAEKLKALADGLGVDPDLLFHLACGMPDGLGDNRKASPAAELMIILETVQKAVAVPDIIDILNELLRLSPKERGTFLKSLKRVAAAKPRSRRKNTKS
jgi:transcriptional regulator with XRE-family HTH domain